MYFNAFPLKVTIKEFTVLSFTLIHTAIMPHCVDSPLPLSITLAPFDGQNWEKAIKRNT